jgi:hypothetical protein
MIDVEKLRASEEAATPGPWDMNYNGSYEIYQAGHGPSESRDKTVMRWTDDGLPIRAKDAVLILTMRNSLPAILDELEALRAIVKELAARSDEVYADDGFCIFCGETGKHEADCLVSRAQGALK